MLTEHEKLADHEALIARQETKKSRVEMQNAFSAEVIEAINKAREVLSNMEIIGVLSTLQTGIVMVYTSVKSEEQK